MKAKELELDPDLLKTISKNTTQSKDSLDLVKSSLVQAEKDSHRAQRIEQSECRYCFYLIKDRVKENGMFPRNCQICRSPMIFNSNDLNSICKRCSKKHELCVHCMGQLEFLPVKKRRKIKK